MAVPRHPLLRKLLLVIWPTPFTQRYTEHTAIAWGFYVESIYFEGLCAHDTITQTPCQCINVLHTYNRRKFRRQTSDKNGQMKSRDGKSQRREEERRSKRSQRKRHQAVGWFGSQFHTVCRRGCRNTEWTGTMPKHCPKFQWTCRARRIAKLAGQFPALAGVAACNIHVL